VRKGSDGKGKEREEKRREGGKRYSAAAEENRPG